MIKSKIGTHVSIAGGIYNAPSRAHEEGGETFQCFIRSPHGGKTKPLTQEVIDLFRAEMKKYKLNDFYIHSPYFINLASLKPAIKYGSISVLREQLEQGSLLGATYVMTHLGSHNDQTLEEALDKVCEGIYKILEGYSGTTKLLIEISAGSGNVLGDTFKEIGAIVQKVKGIEGFGGVCFDTCHAFAAGYDYRSKEGLESMLNEFEEEIGLEHLKLTHVNDSKADLGGKLDRHEHIGKGYATEKGIANILTSKPFSKIDWILETKPDGRLEDVKKLKEIRGK